MKIPVATLAEYAVAKDDGTFYVAGGFDTLVFDTYPHTIDRISLAVKVEFERSDAASIPAVITMLFEGPDGSSFAPATDVAITPRPGVTLPAAVTFVYNISAVQLPAPGRYTVRLTLRDAELASPSFQAQLPEVVATSPTYLDIYGEAFDAYRSGDVERAEALFRSLATDFPSWGVAQNALGFILLAKGMAEAAEHYLRIAQRLGGTQPEILDVNLGCCAYLLGNYESALEQFTYCLRTHKLTSLALLVALNEDEVITTTINTAGDYIALVALNAAWSALRLRDFESSRKYLNLCRASFDIDGGPSELSESLELAQELLDAASPPPQGPARV